MKKIIVLLFALLSLPGWAQEKQKGSMKRIKFIPKEFGEIKLGYNERVMNKCSPNYPSDILKVGTILINIPQKVICKHNWIPVIPVCMITVISLKRLFKYDHLSEPIIHIKRLTDDFTASGPIWDKYRRDEFTEISPLHEEEEKKRMMEITKAQLYNDDELDEDGYGGGNLMNIDAAEYVDMPFTASKYEVWVSQYGLESNHAIVEIVYNKK